MPAIARNEDFTQVVVWPSTLLPPEQVDEFVQWVADNFLGTRVQFLESITTKPDYDDPASGGRADVIFAVHRDDVGKFAVPRLMVGMRWIEDVLDNETRHNIEQGIPESYSIYPDHVKEYRTW